MGSPSDFDCVHVAHIFLVSCVAFCLFVLVVWALSIMLSFDCPFFITPSVLTNVYLSRKIYVKFWNWDELSFPLAILLFSPLGSLNVCSVYSFKLIRFHELLTTSLLTLYNRVVTVSFVDMGGINARSCLSYLFSNTQLYLQGSDQKWHMCMMALIVEAKQFKSDTSKHLRRVWKYQRGNQNPYIEEEQTTQWPKEKVQKDKQRSTKHTYKTKDRVTLV